MPISAQKRAFIQNALFGFDINKIKLNLSSTLDTCCQLYKQGTVVGLNTRIERGSVALDFSATLTLVYYNKAMLGVGLCSYGTHKTLAGVCSVSRVYVHVERPQAKGTMVS